MVRYTSHPDLPLWRRWVDEAIRQSRERWGRRLCGGQAPPADDGVPGREEGEGLLGGHRPGRAWRGSSARATTRRPEGLQDPGNPGPGADPLLPCLPPGLSQRAGPAAVRIGQRNGSVPRRGPIPEGSSKFMGKGAADQDWTKGCVALTNHEMDELAGRVKVGTPVAIVGYNPRDKEAGMVSSGRGRGTAGRLRRALALSLAPDLGGPFLPGAAASGGGSFPSRSPSHPPGSRHRRRLPRLPKKRPKPRRPRRSRLRSRSRFRRRPAPPPRKPRPEEAAERPGKRDDLAQKLSALAPKGTYLLIDTGLNRLYLMKNQSVVREAVCSTGSGRFLPDPPRNREWTFDTPKGEFRIQKKIVNPVWIKPDWAFIEEGEALPKRAADRVAPDELGDYAMDLGDGYLIHGTLYERSLGMSVTHGCVRVGAKDLDVIFHAVKNRDAGLHFQRGGEATVRRGWILLLVFACLLAIGVAVVAIVMLRRPDYRPRDPGDMSRRYSRTLMYSATWSLSRCLNSTGLRTAVLM